MLKLYYIYIGEDSQVWCAGHSRLVLDGKYNDALSILTVQHRIILSPTSTGQIILPICLAEVHMRGNTCESSLVIHRLGCVHFLGKDSYIVVADYSFLEVRLDHFFSQFVWYLDKQPKHDLNLFHPSHTTDIIFSVSIVHPITSFFFGCVPEGQLPGFLGIPLN